MYYVYDVKVFRDDIKENVNATDSLIHAREAIRSFIAVWWQYERVVPMCRKFTRHILYSEKQIVNDKFIGPILNNLLVCHNSLEKTYQYGRVCVVIFFFFFCIPTNTYNNICMYRYTAVYIMRFSLSGFFFFFVLCVLSYI